ncbi:MAG: CBS domain-containing protein [Azonexus sp.]|jgi:CBS domain-containing protein|uniref:CBS domain-containing protein n=1 Tax=Azonexus sp. TaxID=1872668 RepID=UPI002820EC3F|nr:CBS domain-containing protein [Azonexus sp.]MDR0776126.1 CBS domain-containing protein [Azonexus sp.]
MKTLKQLLADKLRPLAVVAPSDTVFHALAVMAEHDVGAVLVLDGEQLVGIFSERDYARRVILHGKASKDTAVRDVMSDRVAYVTYAATFEECMALMTEKHFRHLPVLNEDGSLAGVVSIGDMVKETISSQQFLIKELERYIVG